MKKIVLLVMCAIAIAFCFCGCASEGGASNSSASNSSKTKTPQEKMKIAYENGVLDEKYASHSNDYTVIYLDTDPEDDGFSSTSTVSWAVSRFSFWLDIKDDYLWSDMTKTSAIMGRQYRTYRDAGIEVSWAYNKNTGLEITYRVIQ